MKTCRGCFKSWPRQQFSIRPNGRGGHKRRSRCRQCERDAAKLERITRPPEVVKRQKEKRRVYNRKNNHKVRAWARRRSIKQMGLDPDSVIQYASTHNIMCECCGRNSLEVGTLHVDHDHQSKVFRGMLCTNCNTGLGHFADSPERLTLAIDYLLRPLPSLSPPPQKQPLVVDESDERLPSLRRGEDLPWHKLTAIEVGIIKRRLMDGESVLAVAADYKVSRMAIYQIKYGRSWKDVEPADNIGPECLKKDKVAK